MQASLLEEYPSEGGRRAGFSHPGLPAAAAPEQKQVLLFIQKVHIEPRFYLAETELSISRICAMVGFNNSSYFSKIFKQEVGMPPNEYRKKFRKDTNDGPPTQNIPPSANRGSPTLCARLAGAGDN